MSIEDCAKHCFKDECTLLFYDIVILIFVIGYLVEILEIWMMLHKHLDPIEASPCIVLLHIATPKVYKIQSESTN